MLLEQKIKQLETKFSQHKHNGVGYGGPRIDVTSLKGELGGNGGGHVIQEEGTSLTQRAKLNFIGLAVTATDDAGNNATKITIDVSDKEPAFSKNTGFNKNFGTTSGTVAEGNHTHATTYGRDASGYFQLPVGTSMYP